MELGKMLAISYREYQNYMRDELKEFSLGNTDYPLLLVLDKFPGMSQNEVGRKTRLSKSVISKSVCKLLEMEYIQMTPDENHRQKNRLYLTKKGMEVLPYIDEKKDIWRGRVLQGNTEEDLEIFFRVLNNMFEKSLEMK